MFSGKKVTSEVVQNTEGGYLAALNFHTFKSSSVLPLASGEYVQTRVGSLCFIASGQTAVLVSLIKSVLLPLQQSKMSLQATQSLLG